MPGTMRTVPLYMEFKSMPLLGINLLETFWPIWLMAGANAFNIILFKNFFDGISESLVEAAWIDGCSDIMLFFKIIIPLSVPVFVTVANISAKMFLLVFIYFMVTLRRWNMDVLPRSLIFALFMIICFNIVISLSFAYYYKYINLTEELIGLELGVVGLFLISLLTY